MVLSPAKGRKCYPCLRYEVLPLCQEAHRPSSSLQSETVEGLFLSGGCVIFRAPFRTTCGRSGRDSTSNPCKSPRAVLVVRDQAAGKPRDSRWPGQSIGRRNCAAAKLGLIPFGYLGCPPPNTKYQTSARHLPMLCYRSDQRAVRPQPHHHR